MLVASQLLLGVKDFAAAGALQVLEPVTFVSFLQVILKAVDSDNAALAKFAAERFLLRQFVSSPDVPGQSKLVFAECFADLALQVGVINVLVNLQSIWVLAGDKADLALVAGEYMTFFCFALVMLLLVIVKGFLSVE